MFESFWQGEHDQRLAAVINPAPTHQGRGVWHPITDLIGVPTLDCDTVSASPPPCRRPQQLGQRFPARPGAHAVMPLGRPLGQGRRLRQRWLCPRRSSTQLRFWLRGSHGIKRAERGCRGRQGWPDGRCAPRLRRCTQQACQLIRRRPNSESHRLQAKLSTSRLPPAAGQMSFTTASITNGREPANLNNSTIPKSSAPSSTAVGSCSTVTEVP